MLDLSPLWISLKVALPATIFTFVLGICAARTVVKLKHGQAQDSLDRPLDHVGPADPAHRGSLGGPAARAETVRHLRYHRSRGSPFLCNNIHNSS